MQNLKIIEEQESQKLKYRTGGSTIGEYEWENVWEKVWKQSMLTEGDLLQRGDRKWG